MQANRYWMSFLAVTVLAAGLAGCGAEPPATTPAASGQVNSADESSSATSEEGLDGNSEPPLADVSAAVESVPAAGGELGAANPDGGSAEAASAIVLTTVSPEEYQAVLEKHAGKVILVDFWATWCRPCIKGMRHTLELSKQHAERGLVVLTICMGDGMSDEEREAAIGILQKNGLTLENLICSLGGGDDSFDAYEIGESGLPHFKIYDREGKLWRDFRNTEDKAVDPAEIDKSLEEILAE